MSEFIAGAFVDVQPSVAGFREELVRKLDTEVKKPIPIAITVDTVELKKKINDALKSLVKVPVDPVINKATFRASVKKQADDALKGFTITIPVEAGAASAAQAKGAAAGAAGKTGGSGSARKADVDLIDKGTGARKKQTEAEKRATAVKSALAKASDQQAIAERLLAQGLNGALPVEEKALRLRQAHAASSRAAKAANDVLATSGSALTNTQRASLETALDTATATRVEITAKQQLQKTNAAQAAIQTATEKGRKDSVRVMGVEIGTIQSLNRLHLVENDLLALESKVRSQLKVATDLNVASAIRENKALLAQIELRKRAIVDQRLELKGDSVRARNQKTAARGGASTLLSLLGIRGATLAANSAFLAGAAAVALFAKSLGSFAKFEEELNVFQATAGATAVQMAAVAELAEQLGADITLPGVTAADAAQSMAELARAGLSVRDSMEGARGVLQLAAAAQISNSEAANVTASALNAFSLAGDQAVRVADLLANAANASQGSITEFSAAMQQALTISNLVGLSLQDTMAVLTLFARNGLKGSDAGTSLRTALSRLIAPTKDAAQLIEQLGLNVRDAQGNVRADVFAQFGVATKNLTPALRDMIAQTIAGQDAIRAFAIGAEEGAGGLKAAQLQMSATGTAAALAAARSKGLAGEFRALSSNIDTLGTKLGAFAAGPVSEAASGLNSLVTELNLLASGDFGGFARNTASDLQRIGEEAVKVAGDVRNISEGLSSGDFSQAAKGFKGLLRGPNLVGARGEEKEVTSLQDELLALQNARVAAFKQGFNINPFTDRIKEIRAELRALKIESGEIIPLTNAEKALAPLQDLFDQLQETRKILVDRGDSTTFIDKLSSDTLVKMNKLNVEAVEAAKKTKKDILKGLTGTEIAAKLKADFDVIGQLADLGTPEVLAGIGDKIRDIGRAQREAAKGTRELFVVGKPKGLLEPGNLDLLNRKVAKLGKNVTASVRSISVEMDGKEILIPTVIDGKALKGSAEEIKRQAVAHFQKTGEHLGKFASVATANAYAATLHQQQAKLGAAMARVAAGVGPPAAAGGAAAGKGAVLALVKSIQESINALVAADNPGMAQAIFKHVQGIADLYGASFAEAFKGIKVPLTDQELTDALLPERIASARAAAFGTVADQIKTKQAELAKLNKQLASGKAVPGSEQEEKLINDIGNKKQEIRSLREQAVNDEKEKDAVSDKKVLDALSADERKRQNALVVAQTTESLKDDIGRQLTIRAGYLQQIDQVNATVRDAETRKQQLGELNQKLFEIDQDIAANRAGLRQQGRDKSLQKIDEAAETAEGTESLADNQRQANRKVAFWRREVAIIRALVRARKATTDELDAALDSLDDAEDDARQVARDRRQQIREDAIELIDEGAERADETESLADNQNWANRKVARWKREVEIVKKLVRDGRASKDELQEAYDALDEAEAERREVVRNRRQQIKDLREERLDLRIQIAQDTENTNAEIAAREAKIRHIQKQMQATKKESIARLRLMARLRAEEKELKELKGQAKEKKEQGTTAFELLTEAANVFAQTGGNLINGNQPFAGAAGFTADMAQFLYRNANAGATGVTPKVPTPSGAPVKDALSRNDAAHFQNLSEELRRLREAILRGATVDPKKKTSNAVDRNDRAHNYAVSVQSRRVREGRSGY